VLLALDVEYGNGKDFEMVMHASHGKFNGVLIVEDDHSIRELYKEVIEFGGFKVHTAGNGLEALNQLRETPAPCLIILDMMMPVMNGREFLDVIKKDNELAKIPIYVFSANANTALAEGSLGLFPKPVELEQIMQIVSKHCVRAN
jgi:CheY-like chemotaxis protein